MSPILLERADFIKIGLLTTMVLPALFVSGFIFGYTKAENHGIETRDTIAMALPEASLETDAEREPAVPETLSAGHDRDVDVADHVDDEPGMQHQHVANKDTDLQDSSAAQNAAIEKPVLETAKNQPTETALGVGGPHEPASTDPLELMLDTADEDSARFTVQVGLFGSQDNAERKVDSLVAMRLNAYTTEFKRRDSSMHNVRFGFFASRSDANAALESYRQEFSGDGYIISIKR